MESTDAAMSVDFSPAITIDFYASMRDRQKKPDALQGTLDLLVLKTLSRGPAHGYVIATQIAAISGDVLRVEEGSLYPALHRMEQSGWLAAEWRVTENNRRARLYRVTQSGQKRLHGEQEKWHRLTKAVAKVLRFA
jgi:PadR family transcriptional regulator PadR